MGFNSGFKGLIVICTVAQAGRSTELGAHPASCTMGTRLFPGGKVARAWR